MTKNRLRAVSLLAAGAVAGGILAATLSASAAGSGSSGSSGTTGSVGSSMMSQYGAPPMMGGRGGGPGARSSTPVRSDESAPSASLVSTLTAKAEAKVPGGTVYRVETDAGDAAYEAHMTKSDGSLVTVKFDKNLDVTAVEDGMGQGDPAPAHAPNRSGSASSSTAA